MLLETGVLKAEEAPSEPHKAKSRSYAEIEDSKTPGQLERTRIAMLNAVDQEEDDVFKIR